MSETTSQLLDTEFELFIDFIYFRFINLSFGYFQFEADISRFETTEENFIKCLYTKFLQKAISIIILDKDPAFKDIFRDYFKSPPNNHISVENFYVFSNWFLESGGVFEEESDSEFYPSQVEETDLSDIEYNTD